ncbi:unnamed protein product [Mycena citricolor]|uniref:lytic cellulose monooxygenase (C4-dehydrogenating) n=1 Tax=Mycena citricolor TaxID=2018698 RepID=A0AAD2HZ39_9AGAR|nr:unnamed protein product [Mycena citricolor]
MQFTVSFAIFLSAATLVVPASAHGWTSKVVVGGKSFLGNEPAEQQPTPNPSIVRQISTVSPVKDLSSTDLICGNSATKASQVATVAAGSAMQVTLLTLSGNWFHDVGPIMAYMASCGSTSCKDFDATGAKWFKIYEAGLDPSTGTWFQANLDNGSPINVTIPANLKAGNYLLRTEVVALHTAQSPGGAEFYPSCSQLSVTGTGSAVPKASELVQFPGAYGTNDPGVLIDVYDMKAAYRFPGPVVASFVSGSSAAAPPSNSPQPSESASSVSTETATHSTTVHHSSAPTAKSTTAPHHTTTVVAPASTPTSTTTAKTCKAKHASRRRDARIDRDFVRNEVRRSRARHMHAGAVPRSF